jgi:NAD(P)-dependent dehydrogenase (short-subunit alcohol dehydrogenase family)
MSKVVLITGASSGIGKVTATTLAAQGYRVFGTSRRANIGVGGITMLQLDVSNPDSVAACVQQVIRQAGRIDVLVNNAAIVGPAAASEETSLETWQGVFDTNLFGLIRMTNAVLPIMREQGGGKIINISSMAGFMAAPPYFSAYIASKHALEGYTETLRYEVAPFGVHVSLIQLGYMNTAIDQSITLPDQPIEAYAAARRRVYEADLYSLRQGNDPALVARTVQEVLQANQPRLRYHAGAEALSVSWMKRLLPFPVFERAIRWIFLEGEWDAERPGIRRLFLDAQMLGKLQRIGALAGTALSLLLGGVFLSTRKKSARKADRQ